MPFWLSEGKKKEKLTVCRNKRKLCMIVVQVQTYGGNHRNVFGVNHVEHENRQKVFENVSIKRKMNQFRSFLKQT